METFSAWLAICVGNSSVPSEFPAKGQWRGALVFSLICVWISDWVNNREVDDLRRYHAHYDVIVMDACQFAVQKSDNSYRLRIFKPRHYFCSVTLLVDKSDITVFSKWLITCQGIIHTVYCFDSDIVVTSIRTMFLLFKINDRHLTYGILNANTMSDDQWANNSSCLYCQRNVPYKISKRHVWSHEVSKRIW